MNIIIGLEQSLTHYLTRIMYGVFLRRSYLYIYYLVNSLLSIRICRMKNWIVLILVFKSSLIKNFVIISFIQIRDEVGYSSRYRNKNIIDLYTFIRDYFPLSLGLYSSISTDKVSLNDFSSNKQSNLEKTFTSAVIF